MDKERETRKGSENNGDLAVFENYFIGGLRFYCQSTQHLTCFDMKDRAMAQTTYRLSFQFSIAKSAAAMAAFVIKGVNPGIEPDEEDFPITDLYFTHIPDRQISFVEIRMVKTIHCQTSIYLPLYNPSV